MTRILQFLLLLLCPAWAEEPLVDDQPEKSALESQVNAWIESGDSAELDAAMQRFLAPAERWPSGERKLRFLYEIAGSAPRGAQDEERAWKARDAFFRNWAKEAPKNFRPWLLLGELWTDLAWSGLGTETYFELEAGQKKLFRERMREAKAFLEKAGYTGANEQDPQYFDLALRCELALSGGGKGLLKLFGISKKKFSGDASLAQRLYQSLLPRWKGGELLAEAFNQGLQEDPECAVRALLPVFEELHEDSNGLPWIKLGYPSNAHLILALRGGIERIEGSNPRSVRNYNLYAKLADLLGFKEMVLTIFKKLDSNMDPDVWKGKDGLKRFQELDGMSRDFVPQRRPPKEGNPAEEPITLGAAGSQTPGS
jgi:hypothetical protein